jgi:hypothetical protein
VDCGFNGFHTDGCWAFTIIAALNQLALPLLSVIFQPKMRQDPATISIDLKNVA